VNEDLLTDLTYQSLTKRDLSEATCKKFQYAIGTHHNKPVQVANYHTPAGQLVAQKVRYQDKDFTVLGDISQAGLFGQHLWRDGGKYIVITEGEIDALSVSQAVFGNKWPVVSVPNGAAGAKRSLQKQLEWLEKFENIILLLDSDDAGRKAAASCVDLFTPGKCKIGSLPLKDANEMLKAGRVKELTDAVYGAKAARPDGILAGSDLWDTINTDPGHGVDYPWPALTALTRGQRNGEIVLWAAGTGIGKSEVVSQVAYWNLMRLKETVGYIALEENKRHTGLRMMNIHLGRRLHLDLNQVPEADRKRAFEETTGNGRFFLYDHWGSTASDNLLSKIRYLVRGCGCTSIILDHLSMVVSGIDTDNERKLIDTTMTNLRSLVEETQCKLHLISHLRKPEGTAHEDGGRVNLDDFRGSGSIKQLIDIGIGLERNQQDEAHKNFTHIRVLKNRFEGTTGSAGYLKFDPESGALTESSPYFDEEPHDETPTPVRKPKALRKRSASV
jgi:twinkle protein